jgi:predicted thioesterase
MKSLRYLSTLTGEMADIEVRINEVNGREFRNVINVDKPGHRVQFEEPVPSF